GPTWPPRCAVASWKSGAARPGSPWRRARSRPAFTSSPAGPGPPRRRRRSWCASRPRRRRPPWPTCPRPPSPQRAPPPAAASPDRVGGAGGLLVRLGAELALPLVTPALATLVRTANRVGAAAKPSGAGAGDCGIALATSAAQAAAVRAAWQDAGILPLPVQ